jgi:prevent-host-death family protein
MKNARKSSTRKKGVRQHSAGRTADFLKTSKRYYLDSDVEFDRPVYMEFPEKHLNNRSKKVEAQPTAQGVRGTWKLQDAKAQFSELVRRARAGEPQQVTVHGKPAVVVLDPGRFEFRAKPPNEATLAGFVERSKKYRGPELELPRRVKIDFANERNPFEQEGP